MTGGAGLTKFLDGLDVEELWIPGRNNDAPRSAGGRIVAPPGAQGQADRVRP